MNRRGFTLLELLIVIGLVLGLGALVWPAMTKFQQERIFDSTVEIVRDQLMLARAHAQATGKPVEVIYLSQPPRVEARMFDPILKAMQENDDLESLNLSDEQLEDSVIAEPWAYRHLASKVRISNKPQQNDDGDDLYEFSDFPEDEFLDFDQEPQPRIIRLAIFLSDGSALLGKPFWIVDSDNRQGRIAVNPWTGIAGYEQSSIYQSDFDPQNENDDEFEKPLQNNSSDTSGGGDEGDS
ncbi:MAG: prepilin-type N-terminal cleavage/methylation domain-containing protein [Planctomycetes bacterium]|nr:prepilin-type N-terminal cleavage/methylation domain-containing protein [Planctomycetota bacterium]